MKTPMELAVEIVLNTASDPRRPTERLAEYIEADRRDIIERCAALVDSFYVEWPNSPTIAARIRALSPDGTAVPEVRGKACDRCGRDGATPRPTGDGWNLLLCPACSPF